MFPDLGFVLIDNETVVLFPLFCDGPRFGQGGKPSAFRYRARCCSKLAMPITINNLYATTAISSHRHRNAESANTKPRAKQSAE